VTTMLEVEVVELISVEDEDSEGDELLIVADSLELDEPEIGAVSEEAEVEE